MMDQYPEQRARDVAAERVRAMWRGKGWEGAGHM